MGLIRMSYQRGSLWRVGGLDSSAEQRRRDRSASPRAFPQLETRGQFFKMKDITYGKIKSTDGESHRHRARASRC